MSGQSVFTRVEPDLRLVLEELRQREPIFPRPVLRPGETHRVIEQGALHHGNEVFKCLRFAGLTAERKPLIPGSIGAVVVHSYLMSK